MTISITDGTTTEHPVMVLGYESSSDSRNVFHDILGGTRDVSLVADGPRAGTLDLFFLTEATAEAARQLLRTAARFTYSDDERPTVAMSFVRKGTLRMTLDPDTRTRWTVSVGFEEVNS